MTVRADLNISLDGFATTTDQTPENPFGEDWGRLVAAYVATRTFIDTIRPKLNGMRAMLRARQRVLQLTRSELMDITEDWVHSAFTIEEKDRAYIERLVMLQDRHTLNLRRAG